MIFILLFIAITFGMLFVVNKKEKTISDKTLEETAKITTLFFMVLSFVNIFLPDGVSARIYPEQEMYQNPVNKIYVLFRWLNDITLIALPIAIFYKKEYFKKIIIFISFPVLIVCICLFNKYIEMYTNGLGEGIMNIRFFSRNIKDFFVDEVFRKTYLFLLFIPEIFSIMYVVFNTKKEEIKFKDKKAIGEFLILFLGIFISIVPIYAPSYIFNGYTLEEDGFFKTFVLGSFQHIMWIIYIPTITIVLYKIFKKLDQNNRYIAILCLSIALFYQFSGIYTCFGEIVTQRYPLQLCNLASLLILPTILTKNKSLSKFCLLVNVPAALIAVVLCDSAKAGITYIMNVHYIVEHTKVIIIPILAYKLGVFDKVEKSSLKNMIKAYSIYFVFVLILGGIFTGILEKTGNDYFSCNYVFMFNKDSTTSIVPFVGALFDIKIKIFNFFTLSLVQPIIYIGLGSILVGYFYLFLFIDNKIQNKKSKTENINNKKQF